MQDASSFGQWVKRLRRALDLTQEALAEQAACAVQTIRLIESGKRRPSRELALRLAQILELPDEERAAFVRLARAGSELRASAAVPFLADQVAGAPLGVAVAPEVPPAPGRQGAPVMYLPSGTVTFLFTDIEGSTELWERYPQAMPEALARHDALLRHAIEAHSGVVFRTVGDMFCAAFGAASDALAAALAVQRALHSVSWGPTGRLRVRTALHTDTVEPRSGDYLGLALSIVARLLAAAHGGQVVLSRPIRDLVVDRLPPGVALRDLGAFHLKGLSRPERIFQLVAPDLPSDFPPLRTLDWRAPALPVPATSLIGRAEELRELALRLADPACRLLTLVGPGGIGKTRLALQAALGNAASFPDGAYFVSLAPVASPAAIVPAIADALAFTFSGTSELTTQLLNYLRQKTLLLVLDNMEHLLEGTDLVVELLRQAPGVKLLVTSRERLRVQGEWVVELDGLAVPKDASTRAIMNSAAVALFLERARQVQSGFSLSASEQDSVLQICRLLGGMPLGIELAAALVRVLSCAEIAQELERGLDVLEASARDVPERHRSLRAVFDHSWRMLSDTERQVLRQLGVFRGGFGRAAAQEVAGAALPVLASLVDKSLLRRTAAGRYDMHELVRQYAVSQLQADPQYEVTTRDRHASYYAAWLQARQQLLKGAQQQAMVQELNAEIDNIRAAWDWALARGRLTDIRQASETLHWFYEFRSWFQEGEAAARRAANALIEQAQATGQSPMVAGSDSGVEYYVVLGRVLAHHGYFASRLGQFDQAREMLERSITLLRACPDQVALSSALMYQGIVDYQMGDYDRARELLRESYTLACAVHDQWNIALCLNFLGMVAHAMGHYEEALGVFSNALASWRAVGNLRGTIACLTYYSVTLCSVEKYDEAQAVLRESLALSTATDDRWGIGTAFNHLGLVALARGEYHEAVYMFRESLAAFRATCNAWDMARALNHLGAAYLAIGSSSEAKQAYREALGLAYGAKALPDVLQALVGMADLLVREGDALQALGFLAHVRQHRASTRHTRERAERLHATLIAQLPPDQLSVLEEQARLRSLDGLVSDLLAREPVIRSA